MRILAIAAFAALTITASQAAPIITCDLHGCSDSQMQTGAQRANRGHGKRSSGRQEITHGRSSLPGASRSCLTSDTRSLLDQAESHFGVVFKIVSTCRPGARIAGTNHISEHARGRAVDLLVPRGTSKQSVVQWFYRNAKGVTMVYRGMAHVHFDTGQYHKLACGGCGGRKMHSRVAHASPGGGTGGAPQ